MLLVFVALLAIWSGCGLLSSGDDVARNAGRLGDEAARAAELEMTAAAASAAVKADDSARTMSRDTGISLEEAEESVCGLVDLYKQEGSGEEFADWGLDRLQVPPSSRIYWEDALIELGEAVEEAEDGEALDAFVTASCAF